MRNYENSGLASVFHSVKLVNLAPCAASLLIGTCLEQTSYQRQDKIRTFSKDS